MPDWGAGAMATPQSECPPVRGLPPQAAAPEVAALWAREGLYLGWDSGSSSPSRPSPSARCGVALTPRALLQPAPAQRLGTCSSPARCESRGCCPLAAPSPCWGRGVPPLTRPVPQPPASCAPSAPSPEVAAASDMSHSLAGLPLSAPAAPSLQPSSTCKDRKGPAPFHIS